MTIESTGPHSIDERRSEHGHENRQESLKRIQKVLFSVVQDIRAELNERFRVEKGFIDKDATIMMKDFYEAKGTNIATGTPEITSDEQDIQNVEREWAGLNDTEARQDRAIAFGLQGEVGDEEMLKAFKRNKELSLPNQLEMAMTILLHKAFGDKYIVVRASKFDDYFNGIDNVLVNKETGDVICAFDEVRTNDRSPREYEKKERSRKKAEHGGATLKYGFRTQGDQTITKQSIHSIPIYCLGLQSEDCSLLIQDISYSDKRSNPTLVKQNLNTTESRILNILIASIREQKNILIQDEEVKRYPDVVHNLQKVDELLGDIS
jgi:hypothetical protein